MTLEKILLEANAPSIELIEDPYSFEDLSEAEDLIEYLMNLEYPEGWKDIPNIMNIFRIVHVDNIEEVRNNNDLGHHWVTDINVFDDEGIINDIFLDFDEEYDPNKLYIIKGETTKSNIVWSETVEKNLLYPEEKEIYIEKPEQIKIKIIKKLNDR